MECKAFVNRGESKFESSKQMLKVKNFYIEEKDARHKKAPEDKFPPSSA